MSPGLIILASPFVLLEIPVRRPVPGEGADHVLLPVVPLVQDDEALLAQGGRFFGLLTKKIILLFSIVADARAEL